MFAECWSFLTAASLCQEMGHNRRDQSLLEVIPVPSSVPQDKPRGKTCHVLSLTLLPYSTALPLGCPGSSGHPQPHFGWVLLPAQGRLVGAMEGLWGCLPGAFRALYPAGWGDFPSLRSNLPIVGHSTGRWSGLVPPAALAWADSAFKANSDIGANCCFEGSFTFLTGSVALPAPSHFALPQMPVKH